jgi:type III protein arginine methyltransferase
VNDDLFSRYPQLRGEPFATAMLARLMRLKGEHAEALELGMAAVAMAPGDTEVHDLVRVGLSEGVPGWHAPMLHDTARNTAYARGIAAAVRPGMTVLEIGTGAGLVAMLAAREGAEVVTCEQNPMVAAAAVEVIKRNGLCDRIRVVSKPASELRVGTDLPEQADLLVSELFDDMLFGDNIVTILTDARRRLLKPGAPILPPRAELRVALVSNRPSRGSDPLGMVEGFDLSPFNLLGPQPARRTRVYTSRCEQRSEPASALTMDFDAESPFGPAKASLTLRSTGGRVDAVAQWLRFTFNDGSIFENDPFSGEWSHWGAPVFPIAEPIETAPGDLLEVHVRRVENVLLIKAERAG